MIYPGNFERKIEFDTVREMVRKNCISRMGAEYIEELNFTSDFDKIQLWLNETMEFKIILDNSSGFPAQDYFDMRDELQRITIEGTFISPDLLFDLKTSLSAINDVATFLVKFNVASIPYLKNIAPGISVEPFILKHLSSILDDKGNIRNNASEELAVIRKKLIDKEKAVDKKINQILRSAKQSGWVADNAEVTIRDGRQAIPLPASHKRKIQGLILDESATGQTVFMEPGEVLSINNEIRELKGAERREIIRILKVFTEELRPFVPELILAYKELGRIDFIRAKAKFANLIKAVKPIISANPELNWKNAVHPLLYLNHKKQNKPVVPLDISLDTEDRILVISGPNAGGKSVCLKTVGLLQYMVQCGLPVPVKEDSVSGIFNNLFIDIGDEQSLENDLSTYSSHLLNMKNFVLHGDNKTLFLVDEFGTGTEPQLGGAIAEAVLEKLNNNSCFGVITTHYSNLKLLAREGNGIVNGAMLFDTNKMEPLYQLVIGKPGSSFAFEIARKIGFPKNVLKEAEQKTGKKQLDFDEQLQQLDIEKQQLNHQQQEFKVADSFLSELIEKYENLKNDLEEKKKKIIEDAHDEAFKLIESSNKLIEHTIKEIRESQAEKEKTRKLRKEVWSKKEKLKKDIHSIKNQKENTSIEKDKTSDKKQEEKAQDDKIRVGDTVQIPDQDITGEVLSISGDEIVLGFNSITFRTQIEKVNKINPKENKKPTSKSRKAGYAKIANDMNDKLANFQFQLDVRGKRGEEAVELVRQYIDDAILLNMKEIKILHGKGHGILRTLVHDYLRTIPEIKQFKDEHIERGGHGITVVILK